jgi:hypothetical protein
MTSAHLIVGLILALGVGFLFGFIAGFMTGRESAFRKALMMLREAKLGLRR